MISFLLAMLLIVDNGNKKNENGRKKEKRKKFFFFQRHELGLRQVIKDVECSLLECYVRYKDGCWSFFSMLLLRNNVDLDGLRDVWVYVLRYFDGLNEEKRHS